MLRNILGSMSTCPDCGHEADSEQNLKIHYGRAHKGSIAGVEVECSVCEVAFRKRPSHAKRTERHFCSDGCKSEAYKRRVVLECDECGEAFDRPRSKAADVDRHYCSNACKGRAYRTRVELECQNCNATFDRTKAEADRSGGSYCSYECMSDHMRGAVHPKWTGGRYISDAIRRKIHTDSWNKVRERNRSRLPDECAVCEATDDLDLHHIIPLMAGGSHHPENFMIFCRSCHQVAEFYTRDLLDYPVADAIPS